MRVAALYDVHGNLPALEAVLAEVDRERVDAIVCGGDVAAGPMPVECIAALRERGALFVRGNADRELDGWPAGLLSTEELEWLRALPIRVSLDGAMFCHGSPRRDDEILTHLSPDERIAAALEGVAERLVVGGHTHVQFVRRVGERRFANGGSVGCPYEGRPGAFWAVVADGELEHRRTEYDVGRAVERIRATGYDNADALALFLLQPVARDEAAAQFEARVRGA